MSNAALKAQLAKTGSAGETAFLDPLLDHAKARKVLFAELPQMRRVVSTLATHTGVDTPEEAALIAATLADAVRKARMAMRK